MSLRCLAYSAASALLLLLTASHAGAQVPPPPEEQPPPPPTNYDVPEPPPTTTPRYPATPSGGPIAETGGLRIPSRIATRLRVLGNDLNALAARGGSAVADGILSIVTGGLSITLGILIDDSFLSPYLYVIGGVNVARGILDLIILPDPDEPSLRFTHMPMLSVDDVKERLRYGEDSLESLASANRLARILDATLSIGAGIAIIPIFLGPKDFEVNEALDYFAIVGAAIFVISGVINLVTRTEAERRWDAYEELRARLRESRREELMRRRQSSTPRLQAGLAPVPGGAAATIGLRF